MPGEGRGRWGRAVWDQSPGEEEAGARQREGKEGGVRSFRPRKEIVLEGTDRGRGGLGNCK